MTLLRLRQRDPILFSFCVGILALALVYFFVRIAEAGALEADSIGITGLRNVTTTEKTTEAEYVRGTTILATNGVIYTGSTTNSEVQDLTGCTLNWILGEPGTSVTNPAWPIIATNGTWWSTSVVPAFAKTYHQTKITDTNSGVIVTIHQEFFETVAPL